MSISETRAEEILEEIIKGYLQQGTAPTVAQIEADFNAYVAVNDINLPRFNSNQHTVERKEESSAIKYNGTNNTIKEDLNTVFKTLYRTTTDAVEFFDRWEVKADRLENRITNLEGRIGRLLSLAQDTEGYFDTVGDKFTDTSLIDLDLSSGLKINLPQNLVGMEKSTGSSASVTRIFLNDLLQSQAVFNVIPQSNIVAVQDVDNTEPRFAFYDQERYWKSHVTLSARTTPLAASLQLVLGQTITLSRIEIFLHTSESNSVTKVTPLVSTDGVNYSRVPAVNTILESLNKMEFTFPAVQATHIKFLIEKNGHDFITTNNEYVYEFGAREIALYEEAFTDDPNFKSVLISKPLSTVDNDENLTLFNKVTLDVCEATSSETFIDYYVAVAKDGGNGVQSWLTETGFVDSPNHIVLGTDTRLWTPISPTNREEITHPQVLDFSTIEALEQQDVKVSYNVDGGNLESPGKDYTLLQQEASGAIIETACQNKEPDPFTVSDLRYISSKSAHRILNVQIDKDTNIDINNLKIWRNVGEKGITDGDTAKEVRGVQIGWEFNNPYYTTNLEIKNSGGMSIDVGENPITIDQSIYTGVVGPDVLNQGVHKIKVHKDYWRAVVPDLNSLAELKAVDILYPFNQKLLIEGYQYGSSYPDEEEKIYIGGDRFAGLIVDRVGVFDMINNISETDYQKYAIDTDAPSTSTVVSDSSNAPLSWVIVVNTNNSIADFMNEKFVIEFNLTDELFSYAALRAELHTNNSLISPVLDEYKLKLAK